MRTVNINEVIDKSKFNRFFFATVAVCTVTRAFDAYQMSMFGVVIPALVKSGMFNELKVGILASWTFWGMTFGSILFGMLADKIGYRHTIAICCVSYAGCMGLCGFTHSYFIFSVMRFVAGIGIAGLFPILTSIASEYSPLKNRATLVAVGTLGSTWGSLLAVGAGALLLEYMGLSWRWMFYVGFLTLISIPLVYGFIPDSMALYLRKGDKSTIKKVLQKANPAYVPAADDEFEVKTLPGKKSRADLRSLFKFGMASNTILFWIMMFLNLFVIFGLNVWLPHMMMRQGYSFGSGLLLMLFFNTGATIMSPLCGWISDTYGYKRTLFAAYVIVGLLIVVFSTNPRYAITVVVLFLAGGSIHGVMSSGSAYVAVCHPLQIRSTSMGWALAAGRVGGAVAPTLGGWFMAHNLSFAMSNMVWASASFLGAIVILFTRDFSKISLEAPKEGKMVMAQSSGQNQ